MPADCPGRDQSRPSSKKNHDDDQDGAEHSDAAVTEALALTAEVGPPKPPSKRRRWEQYLNLPSDVSLFRSVVDLAQVQSTFLTKWLLTMASSQELFANWMTTQPSSQNNRAVSLKCNRRQAPVTFPPYASSPY